MDFGTTLGTLDLAEGTMLGFDFELVSAMLKDTFGVTFGKH